MGTISQAVKLLKVPRIYNAIITSDKELLPSQAFPALSPVLQSIHFPHFANTLYQPIGLPVMNRNSDSFMSEPKPFDRPMNQMSYDTYAKDTPGIPLKKDVYPSNPSPSKSTPVLFRPNFEPKSNNEENMPNIIPNSNFKTSTANTKKPFYPHYDEEIGQIFNVVNYDNKKVYSASSPTSPDSNSPTTQRGSLDGGPSFPYPQFNTQGNSLPASQSRNNQFLDTQSTDGNQFSSGQDQPSYVDSSPQLNVDQFPYFNDFIKNNAQKDKSIADVPPPPLPVGNPASQRTKGNGVVNPLQLALGI